MICYLLCCFLVLFSCVMKIVFCGYCSISCYLLCCFLVLFYCFMKIVFCGGLKEIIECISDFENLQHKFLIISNRIYECCF